MTCHHLPRLAALYFSVQALHQSWVPHQLGGCNCYAEPTIHADMLSCPTCVDLKHGCEVLTPTFSSGQLLTGLDVSAGAEDQAALSFWLHHHSIHFWVTPLGPHHWAQTIGPTPLAQQRFCTIYFKASLKHVQHVAEPVEMAGRSPSEKTHVLCCTAD